MNEIDQVKCVITLDHMNPQCDLCILQLTACTLNTDEATCIGDVSTKMLTFLTKQMIACGFIKYLIIQVALNLLRFT